MTIELRGVEFVNKGAELMLYAIADQLRQKMPDVRIVMEITPRAPRAKITGAGFYCKTFFVKRGIDFGAMLRWFPTVIKDKLGFIDDARIDVVLDGSGFAFGDKWGADKAGFRLADHLTTWKRQGKKVIMLPQAFGPFTEAALIKKMKFILKHADLVFARDSMSFSYLKELGVTGANIQQAPDFTNLVKGKLPDYISEYKGRVAIIPNEKMKETGDLDVDQGYNSFLEKLILQFRKQGEEPFFLIHESLMDKQIAEEVVAALGIDIPIVAEENPLYVKGLIGQSKAVFTSRFHGLASALSQSIPCLATGWSHKYQMLFNDYNYMEGYCDTLMDDAEIGKKVHLVLDPELRANTIEKLNKNSKAQKAKSERTWDQVFEIVATKKGEK